MFRSMMQLRRCGILALTAGLILSVNNVLGINIVWDGTGSSWGSVGSWSLITSGPSPDPSAVPGAMDVAVFSTTSVMASQTVNLDASRTVQGLSFDLNSLPVTIQSGAGTNTLTIGASGIMHSAAGGTDTISAQVILSAPQMWVNNSGGIFTAGGVNLNGNAVTIDGSAATTLSGVLSGAGGVTKKGGAALNLNVSNTFTGGLTIHAGPVILGNSGALNSTTPNAVSFDAGSVGALTLNGKNVTVSGLTTDATTVGTPFVENKNATPATLTINNASSNAFAGVLQDGTSSAALSLAKSGAGTLTLTGNSSFTGSVTVNAGALNITGGGQVNSGLAVISNGSTAISGSGSAWNAGGQLGVHNNSTSNTATLNINSAAHLTTSSGTVIDGVSADGVARSIVNVDGAGTVWTNTGTLAVGGQGNGTSFSSGALNLTGGAQVTVTNTSYIGVIGGSFGSVTVDGPGSSWNTAILAVADAPTGTTITGTLNVTGGGQVTTNSNAGIGQFAGNTGMATINNPGSAWNIAGSLTLGGAGQGTLNVMNGGSVSVGTTLSIASTGKVTGNGTISGNVSNSAGTVSPGASPGVLTISGNYTQGAGGKLQIELGGTTAGTNYDRLAISTAASLNGMLEVSLVNDFVPMPTAAADVSFDILDWTNVSGKFSTLQLPALAAPAGWNTSQLNTMGVLTATLFVPGDVSRDGHVNIADISALGGALADLSKYQSTHGPGGGALTSQQLLQIANLTGDNLANNLDVQGLINYLANNAGALSAPGGDSSVTAVPEPSSLVLLVLGLTTALIRQRSRSVGPPYNRQSLTQPLTGRAKTRQIA